MLNSLCQQHKNIKIVCSSTWRADEKEIIIESLKMAHNRLEDMSKLAEIPYAIKFDDRHPESWRTTLWDGYDSPRGKAIDKWLEDFGVKDQKYLLIDDDKDFYPWQKHRLIRVHYLCGFGTDTYLGIGDFLKNPDKFNHPIRRQLNLDF